MRVDEQDAWDLYAAEAMAAMMNAWGEYGDVDRAAFVGAKAADALLRLRRKREENVPCAN